jgi:hypothetical protein
MKIVSSNTGIESFYSEKGFVLISIFGSGSKRFQVCTEIAKQQLL